MGEFGDKFRKEREKKKFSLDDVSNVTKIGTRMLQAIEEENFDRLPGGVFNKGFIRAYAKHLGMKDEEAVAAYLACLRQAQIKATEAWEPARPSSDKRTPVSSKATSKTSSKQAARNKPSAKSPAPVAAEVEELSELQLPRAEDVRPPRKKYLNEGENGIPWALVGAAAIVVILAVILWTHHSRSPQAQAASSTTKSAPQPVPVNQTPSPNISGSVSNPPPSAIAPTVSTHSSTSAPNTTSKPAAVDTNDSDAATQPAKITSAPAPLNLVIRATENSWISVQADGQTVSAETLIAPAHTSIRASREIVVKTGNAGGISFLWNGKEIPAEGAEAEVRTFTFDAAGMHTTATVAPAQN